MAKTSTSGTEVRFEPYIGGFILETLTIGMYGESRNAIREYIQNGFDSIQRARETGVLAEGQGQITVTMATNKKGLTIRDDGAGLSTKSATATLTRIGASTKTHARNAGFRGIGRRAGIVFCDTLTFVTKAKGEREQTVVVFDAKGMRSAMSPSKGSAVSAEELMSSHVSSVRQPNPKRSQHFFEVRIEGLRDAPSECTSTKAMRDFLSQVAPVPYPPKFPYKPQLEQAATKSEIELEEINISVVSGDRNHAVYKLYDDEFEFASGMVPLTGCEIFTSPTGRWWGWVGKKDESGAYTDPRVRGLRIRVRNIQIDGADIFRNIFYESAKSYARFQDYYLGEIFIKPTALVPNARRDGFEEDKSWRSVRKEMGTVARVLGKEAHDLSNAGKLSLDAQREALKKARAELLKLKKSNFSNIDKTVALSRSIATNQGRIAMAMEAADMTTSAALAAIGSEYSDMKIEALRHVGDAAETLDRERLETEARDELIQEIMEILEEQLSPRCMSEVRDLLSDYL